MKTFIYFLCFFTYGTAFSQSDWLNKPYVIVNDTSYIWVKHPVFIMDSTLYIRTLEGTVLTFPSRDVNYISKRCMYDRITLEEKNRLGKSVATASYLSAASIVGGLALIRSNYISYQYYLANLSLQYYSPLGMIFGVGFIVPSSIAIYHFIQRKRQSKMILESKGLRFIHAKDQ